MRRACFCLLSAACLAGAALFPTPARAAEPEPVPTRLKRVSLFKNGFGFFVREGTLPAAADIALLGPFAAPSHGTFWVSSPPRAGLANVVVREVKGKEELQARELAELLRANVGKQVTIWFSTDPESTFTGRLLSFAPDRAPRPRYPYALGREPQRIEELPAGRGQFMLLQTDDQVLALDPYRVWAVQFTSPEVQQSFTREIELVELEASLRSPSQGDWLSVSYLAQGITWAPSYLIDISDPKQARLSAKALVINEAEDLDATHVDLVTGFPNLQFADILSPAAMKGDLASFIQSLTRRTPTRAPAGVVTQKVMFASEAAALARIMPDYGAAAAGLVAEDLFLYPLEDVQLPKGETGYYPLFTETVPYTEFCQWEIPDYITREDRYGDPRREQRDEPEVVWHSVRLTNTTKVPWTTAPAQFMNEGHIVGQDTLGYTPTKGKAVVKITQAVSVKAEQTEVEVNRERDAVRLYGYHYDRVTIKGTLSVTNYKAETISLEISKTLSGEVKATTLAAKDVALARGLARMNPVHLLTWTLRLDPGEHKEITYTYEALIRR